MVDCKQPVCSQLQRGGSFGCSGGGGQCDYEIQYGDSSSTTGVLLEDLVSLQLTNGTLAQSKAVFGYVIFRCHTHTNYKNVIVKREYDG